jgi:hypothetical protein
MGQYTAATRPPPVLRWPVRDVKGELAITERRDRQPARRQWRMVVAGLAQGDQAVEVEVGATARALDDMVKVQAAAPTARLAAPGRAAAHLEAAAYRGRHT